MAYTKYSLTPANNNATPPDGAPEGMLPSAVNDTMRDMMAQIRDVGDGIRNGTYTMTAPVITGGSITGVALSGNTFTNPVITGGSISGTTFTSGTITSTSLSGITISSGAITGGTITGVTATGNTFTNPVITGGSINNTPIGASTANTGAFTTLSASGATTFSGATVVSGSLTANTFSSSGATITGGSINSTAIGGSTAAAGAFTTLSASGAFSANGGATLGDASGDALTINSSAVSIPNGLNFDSNTLVIDAANNRIGIGTATPARPLDVVGNAGIAGTLSLSTTQNTDGQLRISNTTTRTSGNQYGIRFADSSFETNASIYVNQNGSGNNAADLIFGTNSGTGGVVLTSATERMRITSTGVALIGRTAAVGTELLSVNGSGRFENNLTIIGGAGTPDIQMYQNAHNWSIRNSAGTLSFYSLTNTTDRMVLNSSGNLGLGVTPSTWSQGRAFEILNQGYGLWNGSGAPASTYMLANAYFNSGFKYAQTGQASHYYQYLGQHVWSTAASGTAGNAITFTQAMTLDASGRLGIGTTSPGQKLHVGSASDASNYVQVASSSTTAYYGADATGVYVGTDSPKPVYFNTNNTERMRIDSSGSVMIGTTSARGRLHSNAPSFNPITGNVWSTSAAFTASGPFGGGLAILDSTAGFGMWVQDTGTNLYFGQGANSSANLTPLMVLNSSGNVGIGTTTNTNSSRLVVNGTISETVSSVQYLAASQFDVGTAPNKIPLNQYLGALAYVNEINPALDVGTGITGGTGTICKVNGGVEGGVYSVKILIDLTGLNSGGTAGDIIGVNGTANPCYIARLPAMTVLGGRMTCLETPAGGDTDIDLYSATEGTGVEDQAISALTETEIINAGAQTRGTVTYFSADPAANSYFYLVGQGTANATYTAGRFLIEIFGVQ